MKDQERRQRASAVEQLRRRIDDWRAALDELADDARRRAASGRVSASARIEALRRKQDVLEQKLTQLRHSGRERFDDLREELDELANEVRAGIGVLRERLRSAGAAARGDTARRRR